MPFSLHFYIVTWTEMFGRILTSTVSRCITARLSLSFFMWIRKRRRPVKRGRKKISNSFKKLRALNDTIFFFFTEHLGMMNKCTIQYKVLLMHKVFSIKCLLRTWCYRTQIKWWVENVWGEWDTEWIFIFYTFSCSLFFAETWAIISLLVCLHEIKIKFCTEVICKLTDRGTSSSPI